LSLNAVTAPPISITELMDEAYLADLGLGTSRLEPSLGVGISFNNYEMVSFDPSSCHWRNAKTRLAGSSIGTGYISPTTCHSSYTRSRASIILPPQDIQDAPRL